LIFSSVSITSNYPLEKKMANQISKGGGKAPPPPPPQKKKVGDSKLFKIFSDAILGYRVG